MKANPKRPSSLVYASENASTLAEMLLARAELTPNEPAYARRQGGQWHRTTWAQFAHSAKRVAGALYPMGIEVGDRIGILGPTQEPWCVYDIGAQLLGAVTFGIYPKQSPEQIRYLLDHSEARVVFVGSEAELDAVLEAANECENVEAVVPWQASWLANRAHPLLKSPDTFNGAPLNEDLLSGRMSQIKSEDTAIFVYTSGTTGPPKCAMITHQNLMSFLNSCAATFPFEAGDRSIVFLPLAHVAQRVLGFYGQISAGIEAYFATNVASVFDEVKEVKPTIFGSVPRLYEKAYAKVHSEMEKKSPAVQRIFLWAKKIGARHLEHQLEKTKPSLLLGLRYRIADKLIFSKVRDAFGGAVRQSITGAAPIPIEILEFFWACGLPIYEVYGMTEATVVTHANIPGTVKLGSVGTLLPGLEHRIADDGEVCIRGPFVFKGYFKDPDATAAAIKDGWLQTGDIGSIDDKGFLRITDRKKHIIITAGGKNLAPANIQNAIKAVDPLISHVFAHGDKRPFVSALVAPSPLETLEFGQNLGLVTKAEIDARTAELMAEPTARSEALAEAMAPVTKHPDFQKRLCAAVAKGNKSLAQVEKVKRFAIIERDFSQEGGELTPTMKVKRKNVDQKYEAMIERLYNEEGFGLEPNSQP